MHIETSATKEFRHGPWPPRTKAFSSDKMSKASKNTGQTRSFNLRESLQSFRKSSTPATQTLVMQRVQSVFLHAKNQAVSESSAFHNFVRLTSYFLSPVDPPRFRPLPSSSPSLRRFTLRYRPVYFSVPPDAPSKTLGKNSLNLFDPSSFPCKMRTSFNHPTY